MPLKYGAKKRRTGSVYKGKRRFGRKVPRKTFRKKGYASKSIIRQPSGVSDRLFVKLKYSVVHYYTSTLGVIVSQQFSGNNVFDPDVTGVGGQPYLYDQWSTMFNAYRVRASSIRAQVTVPPGSDSSYKTCVTVAVVPSNLATAFGATAHEQVREQPYVRWVQARGYGNKDPMVKNYMTTRKIWGQNRMVAGIEDNFASATTTSPATQWYWNVIMYSSDEATTSLAIPIRCTLTYYVEFYRRVRAALS